MEVPEETLEQMRAVKSAVDDLEVHMQPFLEAAPKDVTSQLTPLERVKVHLALAQAVVTLYQLHRRLDAANLDQHPLNKDLERLAAYERKVKKAVTADDLARSRPGTSLNIAAANRFIDAAIPDLTAAQKQQLRALGKQVQQQAAAAADARAGSSRKRRQQEQQQQPIESLEKEPDNMEQDTGTAQHQQQWGLEDNSGDEQQQQQQHIAVKPQSKKKQKQSKNKQRSAKPSEADAQEFLQEVLADLD